MNSHHFDGFLSGEKIDAAILLFYQLAAPGSLVELEFVRLRLETEVFFCQFRLTDWCPEVLLSDPLKNQMISYRVSSQRPNDISF